MPKKDRYETSGRYKKYNLLWPQSTHPAAIELTMIRHGGQWQDRSGDTVGEGLYYHYRKFQEIVWPEKIWEKGPFKNYWAEKCLETYLNYTYIGVMGCAACVRGDTRILNPITGEEPEIGDLCASGRAPVVMTLSGPAQAEVPFVKGVADLYEVRMKSGASFVATLDHRVLANNGAFYHVGSLLSGSQLLRLQPCHRGTTLGTGLSVRASGDLRYSEKAKGSRFGYQSDPRSCDGQPLREANFYRVIQPSPACAQTHMSLRGSWPSDDLDGTRGCISVWSQFFHPSTVDSPHQNGHMGIHDLPHASGEMDEHASGQPLSSLQYGEWSNPASTFQAPDLCYGNKPNQYARVSSEGLWGEPDTLESIKFVGRGTFYDITVPGVGHYYAQGLIHHNSSKSDSFASNVLTDWYANSDCTTVLVSSTDLKSLELRIWGMIKRYHKSAKDKFSWLPGYLIEGKQMLVLDPRSESAEGRDFKNGIIAVACKRGNQFVGLQNWIGIHNKRVRVIGDECFVAGTMVDTPTGPRPIESIRPGDFVLSAVGYSRVSATSRRETNIIVMIRLKDGRTVNCTPNHHFLTQFGWKKACELHEGCYMLSAYEAMCILRKNVRTKEALSVENTEDLQQVLQCEITVGYPWNEGAYSPSTLGISESITGIPSRVSPCAISGVDWETEIRRCSEEDLRTTKAHRTQATHSRREWNRANEGRKGIEDDVSRGPIRLQHQDWNAERQRISHLLQAGFRTARLEVSYRGGRWKPQQPAKTGLGFQEGCLPEGTWVDNIEIQESPDIGSPGNDETSHTVYNLQVDGHPSYSVNGLLAHNCNLMPRGFLDSISNLAKCPDFKLAGLGNPNETTNAHGVLCEPAPSLGGWECGIDQQPGTKTWETRFPNGICLQLPGDDCPNMKAPADEEDPFPFLVTREQLKNDAHIWGVDDWHYTMMDQARMPRGQGSRRVLTQQMCRKFGAFKNPLWRDTRRTSIAFLDAAYRGVGGDRCVFGELQFGYESMVDRLPLRPDGLVVQADGLENLRQIVALIDLLIIPIEASSSESAEDQIVTFVKNQCLNRTIPAENFFFDAGMRTSLVTAFSRIWTPMVNSIDCGGKPSDLMVSADIQKPCREYYSKFITELWFNVRLIVESSQFRGMTEELVNEFSQREWKMVQGNRIEVETKEEMKLKTGRSPDLADAVAIGCYGARRRGLIIKRAMARDTSTSRRDWRDEAREKARSLWASKKLNYAA